MPFVIRLEKTATRHVARGCLYWHPDPTWESRPCIFAVLVEPAVPLHHFEVLVDDAIERHAHLPWPREHVRVLDGRFVLNVIAVDGGVALDDVHLLGVEIPA